MRALAEFVGVLIWIAVFRTMISFVGFEHTAVTLLAVIGYSQARQVQVSVWAKAVADEGGRAKGADDAE